MPSKPSSPASGSSSHPSVTTRLINRVFHRRPKETNTSAVSPPTSQALTPRAVAALTHWAEYGIPSTGNRPTAKRETANSWKTKPFTKPLTAKWDLSVKREDVASLVAGFHPQQMEEKWFVYSEDILEGEEAEGGPKVSGLRVYFHRSWTGMKVAEIEVALSDLLDANGLAEARITSVTWESNSEGIRSPSEENAKSTVRQVCQWVLQVTLPGDEAFEDY